MKDSTSTENRKHKAYKRYVVLEMLQKAGTKGVTNAELRKATPRFTGAIYDLKEEGYMIKTISEGNGVYRYVLVGKTEPTEQLSALDTLTRAIENEGGIVTVQRFQEIMKENNLIFKRKPTKAGV